jgi:hypothetical protein
MYSPPTLNGKGFCLCTARSHGATVRFRAEPGICELQLFSMKCAGLGIAAGCFIVLDRIRCQVIAGLAQSHGQVQNW